MKKLFTVVILALLCQGTVFAQKEKSVKENDVPARYVKDFNNQQKTAQNVSWTITADSTTYIANFQDENGDKMAMCFQQKSTETRYYVDMQYCPHAIKDSVHNMYPKHSISSIYIRNLKGKMSYQCRIVRKTGFLFFKKESEAKLMSFETNGKLIEVLDQE